MHCASQFVVPASWSRRTSLLPSDYPSFGQQATPRYSRYQCGIYICGMVNGVMLSFSQTPLCIDGLHADAMSVKPISWMQCMIAPRPATHRLPKSRRWNSAAVLTLHAVWAVHARRSIKRIGWFWQWMDGCASQSNLAQESLCFAQFVAQQKNQSLGRMCLRWFAYILWTCGCHDQDRRKFPSNSV